MYGGKKQENKVGRTQNSQFHHKYHLTVAGETLVACVKFGVDSDESMLFDLPDSTCCCVVLVDGVFGDDEEFDAPCP